MWGFLRRLANGEIVPSPAISPPGFEGPVLPEIDDIPAGPTVLDPPPPPAIVGRGFIIGYTDSSGARSERRIICRNVYQAEGRRYLQATCLERHAPRCFRVDRIGEVYCGITGEDLGTPLSVFQVLEYRVSGPHFPPARATPKQPPRDPQQHYWFERVRAGARVLMTIARCDGQIHDAEDTRILAFIGEMAARHDLPAYEIAAWARRLAPDFETFLDSFALLCTEPRFALEVVQAAIDVANADGRMLEDEIVLIEDLGRIGAAYGLKIPLERYVIDEFD